MSNRRKLFLHVGYPKTATTTLQKKLFASGGRRGVYWILQPIYRKHLQPGLVLNNHSSAVSTDEIDAVGSSQWRGIKIRQIGQANSLH